MARVRAACPERSAARSRRETTQPNRDDLVYWATGLTPVYLKAALTRTLEPPLRLSAPRPMSPLFDGPAWSVVPAMPRPAPRPILDPFRVYAQGEQLLTR